MFWGLTPALDLVKQYKEHCGEPPEELNILIVGGGDCRHVLMTLARKYRHTTKRINFHLVDACVESIARQMLFLDIALQVEDSLGLEQRTKIFMELYGNTLVRPSVAKYLKSASAELLKMLTNPIYLKQMMNFIAIDIKYKERDYLENLFKFWTGKDEFNICDCWDRRLRMMLGTRYDSKIGAFDWDLHMRFHHLEGGNRVCNQEYKTFRLNGVAFSWLESEVSKPNRTLVCAVLPNGDKYAHHGYLGDMQTGPFVAYGLECEDEDFLKSSNGQNLHRATDITERNLKQIFHEIHHQEKYFHKPTSDQKLGSVIIKQEKLVIDVKSLDIAPRRIQKCLELEDTVNFQSITSLATMKYKEMYEKYFDIVYFGNTYLKYFDKEIVHRILRNNGLLLIENQLFVLSHRKKDLEEFGREISEKTSAIFKKLDFNPEKDSYAMFICNEYHEKV